jgi:hypothetical protein
MYLQTEIEKLKRQVADLFNTNARQQAELNKHQDIVTALTAPEGDIATLHKIVAEHRQKFAELLNLEASGFAGAHELAKRLHDLEVLLLGDREKREIYETARKGHVTPNIPEPPPGVIALIDSTIAALSSKLDAHGMSLDKHASIAKQLSLFFGPMLAGKNPPLDGNLVADKQFVDDGLARLAGAIREEVAPARAVVGDLLSLFKDETTDVKGRRERLVAVIRSVIDRDKAERERAARPSRLQLLSWSLRYVFTGQAPSSMQNGVHR